MKTIATIALSIACLTACSTGRPLELSRGAAGSPAPMPAVESGGAQLLREWQCECWDKFVISSVANFAGEQWVDGGVLDCAATDPIERVADELCYGDTGNYYCGCTACEPTGASC